MNGRLMIALHGDTELSADDKRRLKSPAVGGVILFARNFTESAQLRQLTATIRRNADRQILIAADQEGGRVQRFVGDSFTRVPDMATLAKTNAESRRAAGIVLAAELLAHGIELSFAPVLDIAYGNSDIIGNRAFSADAKTVAACADDVIRGLRAGGMVACGKHFPGHGYATADSHTDLPIDDRQANGMQNSDWLPFAHFAANNGELIMTAHIVYPAIDTQNAATFSSVWLKDILRKQLNFRGLITGDDLSMTGANIGDIQTRIANAAGAGCDLWMICNPEDADDAITASEKLSLSNGCSWTNLSRANHYRIDIGDSLYRQACAQIAAVNC